MNEIKNCRYCGSAKIKVGYQIGDGEMSSDFMGNKTCRISHLICGDCGAILMSRVDNPEIFNDDNRI